MLIGSCVCLQCDMQKLTVEELKRLLYDTFCDHLSMKDIENIIMTEENHIENPEDCQLDIDSKEAFSYMCLIMQPFTNEPAYMTILGIVRQLCYSDCFSYHKFHLLGVGCLYLWLLEHLALRCHFLNPNSKLFHLEAFFVLFCDIIIGNT